MGCDCGKARGGDSGELGGGEGGGEGCVESAAAMTTVRAAATAAMRAVAREMNKQVSGAREFRCVWRGSVSYVLCAPNPSNLEELNSVCQT